MNSDKKNQTDRRKPLAFFDNPDNVRKYNEMAEGYDGAELIKELRDYLPLQSTVLELGMGPGKDLLLLSKYYPVIGSDASQVFVDNFRKQNTGIEALLLDAVSIETDLSFDCVYSNKVLHHLSREDLQKSFSRQHCVLNSGGIIMHSFWHGDKEEFIEDLRFVYYKEEAILKMVEGDFEVLKISKYSEFEQDDSFFVILKKRVRKN